MAHSSQQERALSIYGSAHFRAEGVHGSILSRAVEVFGDLTRAEIWLFKPNERFGGRTPVEMLQTEAGHREVEEMLGQIDEGMFA